jgi:hypothetical protein
VATVPPSVLEALYAVSPGEFTRVRNARVADLRKSGHTDVAEAVRRLRRPTATLWATNQLAHAEPTRLAAFIDAVGELRRVQLRDPGAVAETLTRQRAALDTLVDAARRHLVSGGFKATPGSLARIARTLQGAAVDRQHIDELRHGRLTRELAAPGFEVFAGARPGRLAILSGGKATARAARAAEARQRRARAAEESERAARERRAATVAAEREVEALDRELAEARRRLREARRR